MKLFAFTRTTTPLLFCVACGEMDSGFRATTQPTEFKKAAEASVETEGATAETTAEPAVTPEAIPDPPIEPETTEEVEEISVEGTFNAVIDQVMAVCETLPKQRLTLPLQFAPQNQECIWSHKNREGQNYIQGLRTQSPLQKPQLPKGAVLCSAELRSTNPGATWRFDDEFYLTIGTNKNVLVSSHSGRVESYFPVVNGFHTFDFAELQDVRNTPSRQNNRYCFGLPAQSPGCVFPWTQNQSGVDIRIPAESFAAVSALIVKQGDVNFELHITGDNDPQIDCKHSGLDLSWDVEYVQAAFSSSEPLAESASKPSSPNSESESEDE